MSADNQRYVVWMPSTPSWELPAATDGAVTSGGHRIMHELAVAIAATGRQVEVRGEFDFAELKELSDAGGAAPDLAREPRRPGIGDVVLMPEGFDDPVTFGAVALSGARAILLLLAPPGLFGWSFRRGWSRQSPLRIPLESVGLPEHFEAIAAMGFELWSNSPALVDRIRAAGVEGTYIRAGRPVPFPAPQPKRYDVVTLAHNRWSPYARTVVSHLDSTVVHHEIPACSNHELLEYLGQARILVHPLRIEGDSRIGMEARAMGAVPVVLNSNPFSVGLDEDGGAVPVSSLEEMPGTVMTLLSDPARLSELRDRGMRTAREYLDWDRFVARIDEVLSQPAPHDPGREARASLGESVISRETALLSSLKAMTVRATDTEAERDALVAELDAAKATIRTIHGTRVWRLARWFWCTRDRVLRRTSSPSGDDGRS